MDSRIGPALEATGFLSQEQLAAVFGESRATLPLEPWMLWYGDALWDGRRFHRGRQRQHWELRTAVYLRLAPILDAWRLEPDDEPLIRPDALMRIRGMDVDIALEVDTGRETQRQWLDKLERYTAAPVEWRLLVAARGKALRLSRLASWLTDHSQRPWHLVGESDLGRNIEWQWHPAAVSTHPRPPAISPHRTTVYLLDGTVIPGPAAEEALARGLLQKHGRERRHGLDVVHLYRH